ncbi:trypsin inhibitor ClTI-1-like [Heptranchias perlo]|uniref:trypsin inhibitor ClTI-1-like n=1 Tax=Heptranchias perlo TaxID=212740 RepID=UPI003559F340
MDRMFLIVSVAVLAFADVALPLTWPAFTTPECDVYTNLPTCTEDTHLICGTDGVTYPNHCVLCSQIKETGMDIRIVADSPC